MLDDELRLRGVQRGRELALRRADVIARFFTGKGFDKNGVRVMGHGLAAGSREGRFLRQDELLCFLVNPHPIARRSMGLGRLQGTIP